MEVPEKASVMRVLLFPGCEIESLNPPTRFPQGERFCIGTWG
jgi:hypothetical protein